MASDISTAVGKRIRELRLAKEWRQIDLAAQSGVHEVHISHVERGTREVGLNALQALATALGVRLEELFRGLS